jgi:hypothetical protein
VATGGLLRWDWYRAAPGRAFYLPEPMYLRDRDAVDLRLVAHLTARTLARWSDTYRATPTYRRDPFREGPLPDGAEARERFVDDLFAWFAEAEPEGFATEMSLREGDLWVLDAHDGFPGPLHLRPAQFAVLRRRLRAAGPPGDLYFPLLQQREVVEPALFKGGVVRQVRSV